MEILLLLPLLIVGGIVAMIVTVVNLGSRVKRAEMRLARLEAAANARPQPVAATPVASPPVATSPVAPEPIVVTPEPARPEPVRAPQPAAPVRREPVAAANAAPWAAVAERVTANVHPQEGIPGLAKRLPAFSFEDFFGRRLPIWAGGITLAVAGVLIVNYALAAGLLTPWVQVAAALMFGFGLLAGAEAAQQNKIKVGDPRVAQALAGAGLATLYAAAFVAGNVHGLIPAGATFAAMAAVTAGALALAGRFGAPTALLALAGGFATPALIESNDPNIPLLAGYLALTVAGLTAVGRGQRWAWLGMATLAGGGLWTLVLIANGALDFAATLSVGALVLLLAVAVPLLGNVGARAGMVRTLALLIGMAQLGALVATGGHAPETWAMYALIAAAGQWLARTEPGFAIVPRLSAGLTAMLLLLWVDPPLVTYAIVALTMLAIHIVPLHVRLWGQQGNQATAVEIALLAGATFVLPWFTFEAFQGFFSRTYHDATAGLGDGALTLIALGAAALPAIGLITGWQQSERRDDNRFVILATATALLLAVAAWFGFPMWSWPVSLAALSVLLLIGGELAKDHRFERVALAFATLAIIALAGIGLNSETEWQRLVGDGTGGGDWFTILRWGAVFAAAALVAWRARFADVPVVAQVGTAGLGYGMLAQILPVDALLLVPGVALVGLAMASRGAPWPRLMPAMAVTTLILAGWAAEPLARWAAPALASLAGIALSVTDRDFPALAMAAKQLLAPALLLGAATWLLREQLGRLVLRPAAFAALLAMVAVHVLYRHGFAAVAGENFIASGIAQRLVWGAALLGIGFAIARLAAGAVWRPIAVTALAGAAFAHATYYGLILHNPYWAEQAVGALPLANWLLPLYALPALAAWLMLRQYPAMAARIDVPVQIAAMISVVLFAFSTLRHAFSGSLLMAVPVGQTEDVLRSVLAILLAIGFLLWGARRGRRDWRIASLVLMIVAVAKVFLADAAGLEGLLRIASFVALGFSLIGIGWFYSRQLRSGDGETGG